MKYQDYYKTLGVDRNATDAQIKSAFRKLARKYHPDVNKDPSAVDKFKEINEAYEVLSDKDKRSRYDSLGANWQSGSDFTPPPGFDNYNFENLNYEDIANGFDSYNGFSDFYSSIFGDLMGQAKNKFNGFNFGNFGGFSKQTEKKKSRSRQAQSQNLDITKEITIGAKDIMSTNKKTVKINDIRKCPDCNGKTISCQTCNGTGYINNSKNISVSIPKGIKDGQKIRLVGEGNKDAYGNKGNLYLVVRIKDSEYEINGADVTKTVSISPAEAVIGVAKKEIETLHGTVGIKIPPMTKSGQILRLKSLGLPDKSGFGNLNVKIKINIPDNITAEQKELYEKLLKTEQK
ncbi:MAG: DnaJ domain-containing protein [Candidatus Gastranaerophilales bacterium]|nr:DnaJ domain-containing protein [Candidatus Gastranaerophilales bacterium]